MVYMEEIVYVSTVSVNEKAGDFGMCGSMEEHCLSLVYGWRHVIWTEEERWKIVVEEEVDVREKVSVKNVEISPLSYTGFVHFLSSCSVFSSLAKIHPGKVPATKQSWIK
jgi:hypothetical protein